MKVFVTGVGGQLGHDVMNELYSRGIEGVGSDLSDAYSGVMDDSPVAHMPYVKLDITDKETVESVISQLKPDAVIHCAAWTAVDAAEDVGNSDKVWAVNVQGTRNIASACRKIDCKMVYLSTDYVFASNVFFISDTMVIGPTPPGTGVMNEHFGDTSSNFTSPVSLNPDFLLASGTRVVPTSMTTAPSFTISAFTKLGCPNAAIMISASRHSFTRSFERL